MLLQKVLERLLKITRNVSHKTDNMKGPTLSAHIQRARLEPVQRVPVRVLVQVLREGERVERLGPNV